MLEVRDLDAFYDDSQVLHRISVSVQAGQRVAILGRNGAGKSTFLKSIMNAGPTAQGSIRFEGRPLERLPTFRRARLGLCLVPEDRRIFAHLTTLENIEFGCYGATGRADRQAADKLLQSIPMLIPLRDRPGGQMSGGQQQMLALVRGLAARPKMMLLDEPTEGLAPVIVEQMAKDVVASCSANKTALLLCEQNIWFARACTDRVYVFGTGRVVFEGTWPEFDADLTIRERYLAA